MAGAGPVQLIKLYAHCCPRKHEHIKGNVRIIILFFFDTPLSPANLIWLPCNTRCILIWDRYKSSRRYQACLGAVPTASNAIKVVLLRP